MLWLAAKRGRLREITERCVLRRSELMAFFINRLEGGVSRELLPRDLQSIAFT